MRLMRKGCLYTVFWYTAKLLYLHRRPFAEGNQPQRHQDTKKKGKIPCVFVVDNRSLQRVHTTLERKPDETEGLDGLESCARIAGSHS